MTETDKLANDNLLTQLKLNEDIVQAQSNIFHHVTEQSSNVYGYLKKAKQAGTSVNETTTRTLVFETEDYEKMIDILINLSDKNKHAKLGILARDAVPEIDLKSKILRQLKGLK